jgi:hypothetical protein
MNLTEITADLDLELARRMVLKGEKVQYLSPRIQLPGNAVGIDAVRGTIEKIEHNGTHYEIHLLADAEGPALAFDAEGPENYKLKRLSNGKWRLEHRFHESQHEAD